MTNPSKNFGTFLSSTQDFGCDVKPLTSPRREQSGRSVKLPGLNVTSEIVIRCIRTEFQWRKRHGHGQLKQGCLEYTKILFGNQYVTGMTQFWPLGHIFEELHLARNLPKTRNDCIVAKNSRWSMFCVTAVSPWRGGGLWPSQWNRQSRPALRGARTSTFTPCATQHPCPLSNMWYFDKMCLFCSKQYPPQWYSYLPDNWISTVRSQYFE